MLEHTCVPTFPMRVPAGLQSDIIFQTFQQSQKTTAGHKNWIAIITDLYQLLILPTVYLW